MMNVISVAAGLHDIYPEEENTFERFCILMKQLSLTDTIIWCSRLNLLLANPRPESDHETQQVIINKFLTSSEIKKLNELIKKHKGEVNVFFFFRAQMLQLLRWATLICENKQDDGESFNKAETRTIFLKCALIATNIWEMDTYGDQVDKEMPEDHDQLVLESLESFRKGAFASAKSSQPMLYIPRGKQIVCNGLPPLMPDFETEFTNASRLTLEQYYACSMAVASFCNNVKLSDAFQSKTSGLFSLHEIDAGAASSKPGGFNTLFTHYFNLEAQTASDLKDAFWPGKSIDDDLSEETFDLRYLRNRPIFITSDRRAIIMDPIFFSERFAAGPVFALPEKKRGIALYRYGDSFDAYAKAALSTTLKNAKYEKISNLLTDVEPGIQGAVKIDAVICCPAKKTTDLIILETKANFLSDNPPDYLEELEKKFVEGKDRRVGVGQLADWISALSKFEEAPKEISQQPIGKVFPILLVRDVGLTIPPNLEYLAKRFKEELNPKYLLPTSNLFRKENLLIAPLIIISIDEIEVLELSLKEFSLHEMLDEYSRECSNRRMSFNNFLHSKGKTEKASATSSMRERFNKDMDDALMYIKSTITKPTNI